MGGRERWEAQAGARALPEGRLEPFRPLPEHLAEVAAENFGSSWS